MTVFVLPKKNPFIKCSTCLRKKQQLLTKYKKNKLKQQLLKRTLSDNLIFFPLLPSKARMTQSILPFHRLPRYSFCLNGRK